MPRAVARTLLSTDMNRYGANVQQVLILALPRKKLSSTLTSTQACLQPWQRPWHPGLMGLAGLGVLRVEEEQEVCGALRGLRR